MKKYLDPHPHVTRSKKALVHDPNPRNDPDVGRGYEEQMEKLRRQREEEQRREQEQQRQEEERRRQEEERRRQG